MFNINKFTCIVCGYPNLDFPQYENGYPTQTICGCCGFQSGFDDDAKDNPETIDEYRERWLMEGATWFSSSTPKPKGWNLELQLKNIKQ